MRVLIILALCLSSCAFKNTIETNLFFGTSKPKGGVVTAAEWDAFKKEYVSKVFKEGSTQVSVIGNWYDPAQKKLIQEPTYKLIYFYRPSKKTSKMVDSLCYWYKVKFEQQSVLRVDKRAKAKF